LKQTLLQFKPLSDREVTQALPEREKSDNKNERTGAREA
jgi:hypothetical protein